MLRKLFHSFEFMVDFSRLLCFYPLRRADSKAPEQSGALLSLSLYFQVERLEWNWYADGIAAVGAGFSGLGD
jgi:hypothetical protein